MNTERSIEQQISNIATLSRRRRARMGEVLDALWDQLKPTFAPWSDAEARCLTGASPWDFAGIRLGALVFGGSSATGAGVWWVTDDDRFGVASGVPVTDCNETLSLRYNLTDDQVADILRDLIAVKGHLASMEEALQRDLASIEGEVRS